jgi:hypothetical protein
MSAPNIQQQLYLKNALNESTEGMFDHPTIDEGSMSVSKLGKGKTFNPLKWDKLMAKNAWRQRTREGRDPRMIANPAIGKGIDNRFFQGDADYKRAKAFKEKGIVRKPRKYT